TGEAEGRENADDDEYQEAPPQQLTTAELSHAALETTEQRLQWLEDSDCNAKRSRTAKRSVRGSLQPYKQLLYERICAKQKNAEFYITGTKKQCEDDEELPSTPNRTAVSPYDVIYFRTESFHKLKMHGCLS
ncbi:hypothetical protein M514_27924, partial [Trichuris suis]